MLLVWVRIELKESRDLGNQGPVWAAHCAGTAHRHSDEGMSSDFTEEKKNNIQGKLH